MREIKFRAWDTEEKRMSPPFTFHDITGEDGHEGYIYAQANGEYMEIEPRLIGTRYMLMQYTGLRGKNGKEIYEGDVVNHMGVELGNFEVAWFPLDCAWGRRYQDGTDVLFSADHFDRALYTKDDRRMDFEVIGNVYENPELLNKQKQPTE